MSDYQTDPERNIEHLEKKMTPLKTNAVSNQVIDPKIEILDSFELFGSDFYEAVRVFKKLRR